MGEEEKMNDECGMMKSEEAEKAWSMGIRVLGIMEQEKIAARHNDGFAGVGVGIGAEKGLWI